MSLETRCLSALLCLVPNLRNKPSEKFTFVLWCKNIGLINRVRIILSVLSVLSFSLFVEK